MKNYLVCGTALLAVGLAGCHSNVQSYVSVHQDTAIKLGAYGAANEDCTLSGTTYVTVTKQPDHGKLYTATAPDYPNFPQSNPRSACNTRKLVSVQLWYRPDPGYLGDDNGSARIQLPNGVEWNKTFPIKVK